MPEKNGEHSSTTQFKIETRDKIPVSFRCDNETLTKEHTVSTAEAGVAITDALGDREFLDPLLKGLFARPVAAGEVAHVDVSRIQEGQLEYIYRGQVTLKGGETKPLIFATSKGLFTPVMAEKLLADQYGEIKSSEFRPLYAAYLQQMMEKQIGIDFQALGYLGKVFREKGLPVEIPEPYAFTTKYVATEKVKELQPVSIMAMEMLVPAENCPGGEINPAQYLPDFMPAEGFTWYWRTNFGTSGDAWNDRCTGNLKSRNERMKWMQGKVAELLSYVYFASGRLPFWFSPSAGDVLFLGEKPQTDSASDFHLGLITARGGLYPLEEGFVPGADRARDFRLPKPATILPRNFQAVGEPDLGLLYASLAEIKTKPNLFDFQAGLRDTLDKSSVSFLSRKTWLAEGIVNAYEKFYGRKFAPETLAILPLSKISSLAGRPLTLGDVIGSEKLIGISPPEALEIHHKLEKATETIRLGLERAAGQPLPVEPVYLAKRIKGDTESPVMYLGKIPFQNEISAAVFGDQLEEHAVADGKLRLRVKSYQVKPELVGGKQGVRAQTITEQNSGLTYLEFFQPK